MSLELNIDQRAGLPDELCVLLREHPRDSWRENMTPLAQFWIAKHDDFRDLCAQLTDAGDGYRQRPERLHEFAQIATTRMRFLVALLQGHHQVEDYHYFPAFRAADRRLGRGFDVLARDHEVLHETGLSAIGALEQLHAVLADNAASDRQRSAADRYAAAIELLCRRIVRHLDDEEDLVIPLMLTHR